jgi:hypothetical protein
MKTKTNRELETELIALGNSAKDVASALKTKGIKGKRMDTCGCPLAIYLCKITGEKMSVGKYDGNYANYQGSRDCFDLPEACTDFINSFDGGKFDYLLDK